MTLEIDPERVGEVAARLGRHRDAVQAIRDHLVAVGRRMHLTGDVASAIAINDRLAERLGLSIVLLRQRADQALAADEQPIGEELQTFAGGSVLCSAIQLASPIPSRPSTSGATGAIDAAGVAHDAASLIDAAPSTVAGRSVPLGALTAAVADTVLCRLRVGSGAPISTRTTVDEDGRQIYEGSQSEHKHQTDNGEVLDPDLVLRDRQMWRVEHSNQLGYLMTPYPGYPAYEVNAPRR